MTTLAMPQQDNFAASIGFQIDPGHSLPEFVGQDAAIKNTCGAFLFYRGIYLAILRNRTATDSDIETARGRLRGSRDTVKRQLAMRKSRRFDHCGYRFSLDKPGVVHCCRLAPAQVSPLGRPFGFLNAATA
jgi:hypothetical protein